MPLYEYRCAGCERIFDRLSSYDAATPDCPSCGGTDVRRLISLIGGLAGSTQTAAAPVAGGCGGCGGACACAN
jgi:putative FmdB family regulatory protein